MKKLLVIGLLLYLSVPSWAGFPFSFRKPTIKTDYSKTVWDSIMEEQSMTDMRRGMREMSATNYQAASNSFARAVIKNSKDPLPYLLLGASLYWAGKVDDAISEYNEALHLDPNNAMAYQLLGIASGWKGNVQEAQDYFLKANALDPNKADTHMNLGSTYAVQHNWDKALEHFRQSADLAPREPLYHYQLGTLYEALGRDVLAEESFKKAIHYFSNYEDAMLSLGALYEKLNRPQEALKYYKRAVKTKPGDFVARLRYGFLLMQQGEVETARKIIEQAFSITRFKADGLALNAVYRASGNSAQAFEQQIQKFQESLARVPSGKPVNIEVSLEFAPATPPSSQQVSRPRTYEQAYERLRGDSALEGNSSAEPQTFKRMFALPASDDDTRQQQIHDLINGIRQSVAQAAGKYNVNLSMQGRTLDYNAPSALTQNRNSPLKAVYDPRIVGNDMGLWVMGRTWLGFVDEATEDLAEYTQCPADNTCDLLKGLAALARGNGAGAADAFTRAADHQPQDPLAQLGLGTAAVLGADDEQALSFYKHALELDPKNKVAAKNIKVLADDK
ncbi:MAG: tetratricopeptide repeat protein [Elusimicrobiaceae bacterium]|nr:tetratricopeptide repeat protein [Elusimicrobiaceae bacterium]